MLSQEPYQRFSAPKSLKWQKGILKLESPGEKFFHADFKKRGETRTTILKCVNRDSIFGEIWNLKHPGALLNREKEKKYFWMTEEKEERRRNINWNVFDLKSRLVSSSIPHHKKNFLRRLEDFFPKKNLSQFLTQKDYLESSDWKN